MSDVFCPASMCPLIAPNGSPWTGDKNAKCPQKNGFERGTSCAFYQGFGGKGCDGCSAALTQIHEVKTQGGTFQLNNRRMKNPEKDFSKQFDCDRAHECQWQIERGDKLCPPRLAMKNGFDPRVCLF